MLFHLTISNFAIISHLEIHFKPGLNILSGETGAGKSIIINAVNLILGGRASADLIRTGYDEARVEALFGLPQNPAMTELLAGFGIPSEGELLVKRTISRGGRNRITINGSIATLQMLSRVGAQLISVSGQHEHQLLLKPENHLYILDDFGGLTEERSKLAEAHDAYQSLREDLCRLEREIKEGEEKKELTRFQINEIDAARIREGEDGLLEEEKERLRYARELMEIVAETYQVVYEREGSVLSDLLHCSKRMEKGAELDKRLTPVLNALRSAKVELEEMALELRDLQNTIVIDPFRLEEVEERLQLLGRLKKKYGPSLREILDLREKLGKMIDNLDQKREKRQRIQRHLKDLGNEFLSKASVLSTKRKRAAKGFEKSVKDEMGLLDMEGTRFEARFYEDVPAQDEDTESRMGAMKADGYDRVEFMLSPNVGEELRPLSKIASGGELSRIMLALKTILAGSASVETIIFDEVDSGIGGATAEVVGEKLKSLADYHQILCITHLPQIASQGSTHFLVKKRIKEKRTQTIISELNPEERVKEVARLLGGKVISKRAIAHAREMLS